MTFELPPAGEKRSLIIDWPAEVLKFKTSNGDIQMQDSTTIDVSAPLRRDETRKETRKRIRRNRKDVGDYDFEDPFIDDDEDFFVEQLMFEPEQSGYFAWRGEVAVVEVALEEDGDDEGDSDESAAKSNASQAVDAELPLDLPASNEDGPAALMEIDGDFARQPTYSPNAKMSNKQFPNVEASPTKASAGSSALKSLPIASLVPAVKKARAKNTQQPSTDNTPRKKVKATDNLNAVVHKKPKLAVQSESNVSSNLQDFVPEFIVASKTVSPTDVGPSQKKERVKKPLATLDPARQAIIDGLKTAVNSVVMMKTKVPVEAEAGLLSCLYAVMKLGDDYWPFLYSNSNKLFWSHIKEVLSPVPIVAIRVFFSSFIALILLENL